MGCAAVAATVGSAFAAVGGAIAGGIGLGGAALGGIGAGALIGGGLEGATIGAGIGALGSAVTGGKPLTGALTGALTGGVTGGFGPALAGATGLSPTVAGGLLGAGTGAVGQAVTGGNPLLGAAEGGLAGAAGGYLNGGVGATGGTAAPSDLIDPTTGNYILPPVPVEPGSTIIGPNGTALNPGDAGYDQALAAYQNPTQAAANTVAGTGSTNATGTAGGATGINKTGLALGALAALGSLFSKPQQAPYGNTPGPAQVAANTGPYFNASLNTAVPGRTAVSPWGGALPGGNIAGGAGAYGGPEQTYFTGNSAANFGFARGGALSRERDFRTGSGAHKVRGPGTTVSDSIPAMLSDQEHVLDAGDVRRLGGGDYEKGHHRIDRWRHQLERGKGPLAKAVAGARA